MRGVEQIPWLYEILCSLCEWGGLAKWRRLLVAGADGAVLDLGSGTGRNLSLLPPGAHPVAPPLFRSLSAAWRSCPSGPQRSTRS